MSHLCEQMARGELVHGDSAAASRKMSFNSFSSSSVTHLIVSLVKLPVITDSCVCLFKEVYALLGPDVQIPMYILFLWEGPQ